MQLIRYKTHLFGRYTSTFIVVLLMVVACQFIPNEEHQNDQEGQHIEAIARDYFQTFADRNDWDSQYQLDGI